MPSSILIHPTVWPQYLNVTDRTGQRSDSIGRTVLQTFTQLQFGILDVVAYYRQKLVIIMKNVFGIVLTYIIIIIIYN